MPRCVMSMSWGRWGVLCFIHAPEARARRSRGIRPRGRGHEPGQDLLPRGGDHQARPRALLPRGRRRRAARRRAGGRTCSCASRTASTASSSSRSARPTSRPPWIDVGHAALPVRPHGRRDRRRATRRRSRGWRTSAASSSTRTPCAPTISITPTSCASISIRCRASRGRRSARSRGSCARSLDDLGLVGWPKTSRLARHPRQRAHRTGAGRFDEVRRAALALAREVERRAPALATSKWWKEERHGVFLDYNQNAKDRTVAQRVLGAADARRARVDAARRGTSSPTAIRRTSRCARCRRASRRIGDRARGDRRHARLARRAARAVGAARGAKGSATRRGRRTTRSRRASRRAWSRRARRPARAAPKHAARSRSSRRRAKKDALAGLERWKARHPEAAAHLAAGRRAGRRDARALSDVDAHPRQPASTCPSELRPPQEPPDSRRTTPSAGAASSGSRPLERPRSRSIRRAELRSSGAVTSSWS